MNQVTAPVQPSVDGVRERVTGPFKGYHVAALGFHVGALGAGFRGYYKICRGHPDDGYTYDDYAPAYRTGYEAYGLYPGSTFDASESTLRSDWERAKGSSRLTWEQARAATRAGWHRVERAIPGDFDRDGR